MSTNVGGIDFSVTVKADQVDPTLDKVAKSVTAVAKTGDELDASIQAVERALARQATALGKSSNEMLIWDLKMKGAAASQLLLSEGLKTTVENTTNNIAAVKRIEAMTESIRNQADTWGAAADEAKMYLALQDAMRNKVPEGTMKELETQHERLRGLKEEREQIVQNEIASAKAAVEKENNDKRRAANIAHNEAQEVLLLKQQADIASQKVAEKERVTSTARDRDIKADVAATKEKDAAHAEAARKQDAADEQKTIKAKNRIDDRAKYEASRLARERAAPIDKLEAETSARLKKEEIERAASLKEKAALERDAALVTQFAITIDERKADATTRLNRLRKEGLITEKEYLHNEALIAKGQGLAAANQRGLAGDTARLTFAYQQLAFGLQDATSVFGLTGWSGAVRAASNNVIQFASLIDPSGKMGIATALIAVPIGLIADAFARVKKEANEASLAVQLFDARKKGLENVEKLDISKERKQHQLVDAGIDAPDQLKAFIKQQERERDVLAKEIEHGKKKIDEWKEWQKQKQNILIRETLKVPDPTGFSKTGEINAGTVTTHLDDDRQFGWSILRGQHELDKNEKAMHRSDKRNISSQWGGRVQTDIEARDPEANKKVEEDSKKTADENKQKQLQIADIEAKTTEARIRYAQSFVNAMQKEQNALKDSYKEQESLNDAKLIARMESEKLSPVLIAEAKAIAKQTEELRKLHEEQKKAEAKEKAVQAKGTTTVENWTTHKEALEIELDLLKQHGHTLEENTHHAQRLAEIEHMKRAGVDVKTIEAAKEQDKAATPLENQKKLWQEAKNIVKEFDDPLAKLIKRQKDLNDMLGIGAITAGQYNQALIQAYNQARKDYTIRMGLQRVEAHEVGSAEDTAALYQQMELARAGLLSPGATAGAAAGAGGGGINAPALPIAGGAPGAVTGGAGLGGLFGGGGGVGRRGKAGKMTRDERRAAGAERAGQTEIAKMVRRADLAAKGRGANKVYRGSGTDVGKLRGLASNNLPSPGQRPGSTRLSPAERRANALAQMGKNKEKRLFNEKWEKDDLTLRGSSSSARTGIDNEENAYKSEVAYQKMRPKEKDKSSGSVAEKEEKKSDDMLKALEAIVLNTDITRQNTVVLKPLGIDQ